MTKKSIINKIRRQQTLAAQEIDDNAAYDRIVNMEWDGIPGLSDEDYYVEYISTVGRDTIQQATNVYSVQKPKWDVLPRGLGDVKTAEEFERTLEWYMMKASQAGRKPFSSIAMTHIGKYNKACGQLEWEGDYFCVKMHHPSTVRYEYGSKIHWVSVVCVKYAVEIIERWQDYADESRTENARKKKGGNIYEADKIGAVIKKLEKLVEDDPETKMMYIDYTDKKERYVTCYEWEHDNVDETLGFDDDGKETAEFMDILDKENTLGFINWAIAENEGDPLLAPLHKGKYYDNINDLRTMKATALFRRGLFPMFIQEGREDAEPTIDFQSDTIKTPTGAKLTQTQPPQLDPGYDAMEAQVEANMRQSMAIQNVSQVQVSNVQNATLDSQIKLWLMQFEPNKRTAEKFYEQLGTLMFLWAKKKDKTLKAVRMYSKGSGLSKGTEVSISPDQINLEALYIKCRIMPNNPTDMMERVNQINLIRQSGLPIPSSDLIEELDRGDPDVMREKFEREQIHDAALKAKITEISEVEIQKQLAVFQAQLQMQMQQAMQQMAQPQMPGAEPATQGQPLPSDSTTQGAGYNAAQGGMAPQQAQPGVTQGTRG